MMNVIVATYSPLYKISVQVLKSDVNTWNIFKVAEDSKDVLGDKLIAKTSDPTIEDKALEVEMRPT